MIFINMEKKYSISALERASAMILNEQIAPSIKANSYRQALNTPKAMRSKEQQAILKPGTQGETLSKFWDTYKHDIMFAGSMLALLIPIPGVNVVLSGIISGADAAMYWAEGDRYSAMTMAAFALLPGLGKLVLKIPGIKQIGAKGMRMLFRKVIQAKQGAKVLFSNAEKLILKLLPQNKKLIQSEMAKKLAKSKIAQKIARGATRVPLAAATIGTEFAAADLVQSKVIDPLYTSSGMDISDIESQSDDLFQKIKQRSISKGK